MAVANGEEEKKKTKEEKPKDPETIALEKRKKESVDAYVGQAALFEKEGIPFGFSFIKGKAKDTKKTVNRMIEAGLSKSTALAALTTVPAQLLGIDKQVGTIQKGKMGNLFICDKPYFEEASQIKNVFIDGKPNEIDIKPKKEKKEGGDSSAFKSVKGSWSFSATTPDGIHTGKMIVSGDAENIEVKMIDEDGEEENCTDVALDGQTLTFDRKVGGTMTVNVELTFEDDSYSGTGNIADYGSFPIEGSKTSPEK